MRNQLMVRWGAIGTLALAACAPASHPQALAARVNSQPIALEELGPTSASASPELLRPALERLIDRQLLLQAAQRLKLDRDRGVLARIEAARQAVLVQAYLDTATAQSAPPGAQDIRAYYGSHPEWFARRRLYVLRDLSVALSPRQLPRQLPLLQWRARWLRGVAQVEDWLRASGIGYQLQTRSCDSQQLASLLAPGSARLADGDMAVVSAADGVHVLQVMYSVPAPLSEALADPLIARYLQQRLRAAVARAEMQRLRDQAQIQYLGRFALPAATTQARASPTVRSGDAPVLIAGHRR